MTDIHIQETSTTTSQTRTKPPPKNSKLPGQFFFYAPSDDGTDENLLILLHGLGDTHVPFSKLGKSLKLPQTAILALRAPEQVPFLYEQRYQWFTSFNDLGETIERPNPTPALQHLSKTIDHLINDCAWPVHRIHFFGFAQGGSVAVEFGVDYWKQQQQQQQWRAKASSAEPIPLASFGSIVTVSGPLLSYPTISTLSPTPILVAYRSAPSDMTLPPGALTAFNKAFSSVTESKMGDKGMGMPASKQEWEPIMRFWSQHLARRQVEGLYEVISGTSGGN